MAIAAVRKGNSGKGRMEKKLVSGDESFRTMMELMTEPVIILAGIEIVYANPAAFGLLGADVGRQLIGKRVADILHPDYGGELFEHTRAVNTVHCKFIRLDGRVIDVELKTIPSQYSGSPAVQLLCRELSGASNGSSEGKAAESARNYKRLIKFLPEPTVVSRDGRVEYVNLSAVRLIKAVSELQLIGRSVLDFIHPDDHGRTIQMISAISMTDEPTNFEERRLICVDGDVIQAELSSIRVDDYRGETVMLTVLRDLTERKRTVDSLIQSEKLSVVGQLAAGVAHEIRNPLTALSGFCKLLESKFGSQFPYFEIMLNELDRINLIVNEFMTLAKPHITQFANGYVNEILASVISILETQAILLNIDMETEFDGKLPFIYCEENQLKQVFINVIKNAFEAMTEGGKLKIGTFRTEDGYLSVKITDQGKGIPEAILDKIGGPFFTTKESGTGLGLMICHQIVEAHQGAIQITSQVGLGTTVEIKFPIPN